MIGLLITVLVAAWRTAAAALTGSAIVGIVAAILVLLAGIPTGGFGFGGRWGGRGRPSSSSCTHASTAGAPRSRRRRERSEPEVGLEPTACRLQGGALPTELLRRGGRAEC